ncbi:MAG: hypothetical protein AB1610_08165 [Nitrospirota bacterium]
MRKVVDVNYLRDPRLRGYFKEDKSNFIIFTDFACMECYKGRSLTNIKNSLEIVSDYPEQVLVLKNTGAVIKEDLSKSQQNDIFIDQDQTAGFHDFCIGVKQASGGDFFAKQLLEKSELASMDIENKKKFAGLILRCCNINYANFI